MFYKIVVYRNLHDNSYYYKKVIGYLSPHYVGFINHFRHEVVLIIDIKDFLYEKQTLKSRVIGRLIKYLD